MKKLPLQMVLVRLENGRQGVFVGSPIVLDSEFSDDDCQVDQVLFSNVNELSKEATVEEIISYAKLQLERRSATIQ